MKVSPCPVFSIFLRVSSGPSVIDTVVVFAIGQPALPLQFQQGETELGAGQCADFLEFVERIAIHFFHPVIDAETVLLDKLSVEHKLEFLLLYC